MPELNEETKDTGTDGVVPKPLTASRLAALCAVGFAGGVVGAVVLGLVGVLIGATTTREMLTDPSGGIHVLLFGAAGAVVGIPLGIAAGLHAAGRRLGIRGRFRPAVGLSFAGSLASIGLSLYLMYLVSHTYMGRTARHSLLFLFYSAPFVLSLVGGLVGYLGGRPKRKPTDG
jgi:uncharacterized membrane protein YeaQ/YmgE (transglycosylase-associated protein family)